MLFPKENQLMNDDKYSFQEEPNLFNIMPMIRSS